MLTLLPEAGRKFVMVKQMEPSVTHLGCLVERRREARVFSGTAHVGAITEHITLSAPASIYSEACRACA